MYEKNLICNNCNKKYSLKEIIYRCECGNSLDIIYDYDKLKKINFKSRPFNQLRYKEFFPVKNPIYLGEGGTPIIRSRSLEKNLGFKLYFKLESMNPTGSFKDRGSSVEVSRSIEFGAKKLICASTGNMGASISAYSGVSNIKTVILTPKTAKMIKLEQILAHGSKVYQISANYAKVAKIAESASKNQGFYLLGDYLYRREGTKSIGFELAEQGNFDYIFSPVGNGTLISACWKGYNEFKKIGLVKSLPKLVGVQAAGCSPVSTAFARKSTIKPVLGKTIAVSIGCGSPLDGNTALKSIIGSRGFAESVTDSQILKARELLAKKEGIFAEPGGSTSLAGLLKAKNHIKRGSSVVCLVTGHGLKTPFTGVKGKPVHVRSLNSLGKIKV